MKRLLFALSLIGLCLLAAPQPANAFDLFSGVHCSQAKASAVCQDQNQQGNPISGPDGILLDATNIIAYVAGAAAIIIIIVSAIKFITSGSDTSTNSRTDADIEDAKRSIASALIGLAVIVLAKVLITYVVNKLSS